MKSFTCNQCGYFNHHEEEYCFYCGLPESHNPQAKFKHDLSTLSTLEEIDKETPLQHWMRVEGQHQLNVPKNKPFYRKKSWGIYFLIFLSIFIVLIFFLNTRLLILFLVIGLAGSFFGSYFIYDLMEHLSSDAKNFLDSIFSKLGFFQKKSYKKSFNKRKDKLILSYRETLKKELVEAQEKLDVVLKNKRFVSLEYYGNDKLNLLQLLESTIESIQVFINRIKSKKLKIEAHLLENKLEELTLEYQRFQEKRPDEFFEKHINQVRELLNRNRQGLHEAEQLTEVSEDVVSAMRSLNKELNDFLDFLVRRRVLEATRGSSFLELPSGEAHPETDGLLHSTLFRLEDFNAVDEVQLLLDEKELLQEKLHSLELEKSMLNRN